MSRLDHIVVAVRDIEQGHRFFEQLGFSLTALGVHPFGTGNHLAMFEQSFIEVLSVLDESAIIPMQPDTFSFSAFNEAFLKKGEGISTLVFSTEDAEAAYQRFTDKGLKAYPPFRFSRKAVLNNGREVELSFSIAFVVPEGINTMAFFVCQHHTPEHVWLQGNSFHFNGAKGISCISIVTEEPTTVLPFFTSLLEEAIVTKENNTITIQTATEQIQLCTPYDFTEQYRGLPISSDLPAIAACTIIVKSIKALEKRLQLENIDYELLGEKLIIRPSNGLGTLYLFEKE